ASHRISIVRLAILSPESTGTILVGSDKPVILAKLATGKRSLSSRRPHQVNPDRASARYTTLPKLIRASTMIDIGANLAHDSFDNDRNAVVERAIMAGITRMVITGSDLDSSHSAMALSREYPGCCFATAGLHPHHADQWGSELAELIRQSAS